MRRTCYVADENEDVERKFDFLKRVGDQYGYRHSPANYIDFWRQQELPGLIPPLQYSQHQSYWRRQRSTSLENNSDDIPQVFLDFAGTTLPTASQLEAIHLSSVNTILANPHSTGPAASKTKHCMEQAKKIILDHFHAHPGKFAGMPSLSTAPTDESSKNLDLHPGYEIVFTSGATEALRIVAEYFPWSSDVESGMCAVSQDSNKASTMLYSQNSHTSVLGMRGPALAKGAHFCCKTLEELERFFDLQSNTSTGRDCSRRNVDDVVHNLVVFPAECNFGGDRPNVKAILASFEMANRSVNNSQTISRWWTMLDIAKAASTGPIDLCDLNPDFACVSFYKMFGEPTGLGALFIKRTAIDLLVESKPESQSAALRLHRYFGGGSVDVVLAGTDFTIPRSAPSPLARLTQGTVHFRGIASLRHGFDQLDRLGGMDAIRQHTTCLALELVRRFRKLHHGTGRPVICMYGAWSKQNLDSKLSLLPGPTVAFNVLRHDGSVVGYHEVSKLAALHQPPLQLRTGCFCNPGACQLALGLTDDEIQTNYQISGHVCGDDIDIIRNKPTGAVRASFGKDSLWEDMDALAMFVEKTFVSRQVGDEPAPVQRIQPTVARLTEIYIFPIKSCAAQRVQRWQMDGESGRLSFDREFALVDSTGTAMRLQTHPKMTLLHPVIDVESRRMTVSAAGCNNLILKLDDNDEACKDQPQKPQQTNSSLIQVCGNKCGGKLWGDYEASQWFSAFLGVQCWLARYSKGSYYVSSNVTRRPPPAGILTRSNQVAFANEQPLLLISEHAVSSLNHLLLQQGQEAARTLHFRPNLVIRSASSSSSSAPDSKDPPFEDQLTTVLIMDKNMNLTVVGKCARCTMVDFDPGSGRKGRTLRALADFRKNSKGQITFGVFLQGASSNRTATVDAVWLEEGDRLLCE